MATLDQILRKTFKLFQKKKSIVVARFKIVFHLKVGIKNYRSRVKCQGHSILDRLRRCHIRDHLTLNVMTYHLFQ